MKLSELIEADPHIARSVNLERDLVKIESVNRYVLTGKGVEIIRRLTAGLNGEAVSAWSLTGPYGMGKSAFVHFLMTLCGRDKDDKTWRAKCQLSKKDKLLQKQFDLMLKNKRIKTKGFFRVPITASFESLNRTLARGLDLALEREGMRDMAVQAKPLLSHDSPETTELVQLFQQAAEQFRAPVLLVIDELGKNLEYLSRYPGKGDLFALQTLAETPGIYLWVCLHQAFEEYAASLSNRQRQEWGKIQGRFEDVAFVEPREQMIRFIPFVLKPKAKFSHLQPKVQQWAAYYQDQAEKSAIKELSELDMQIFERIYPLHPLVALALPELCIRFAQNDRTLFAFLCSGEPYALPGFLSRNGLESDELPCFRLHQLYDYFLASASAVSANRPEAIRWLEIRNMVYGARHLPSAHQKVLKTIGLLNLIAGPTEFRASKSILELAFAQPFSPQARLPLSQILAELMEKGILIYRDYADEYRLWEGTDFDIQKAIQEQKAALIHQPLDKLLAQSVPLLPVTASRHFHKTGTLRNFRRVWCQQETLQNPELIPDAQGYDGLILYSFGRELPDFFPPDQTPDGKPLLIAYSSNQEQIQDLILEAAAASAVLSESPELERDGVARKEARFRANAAQNRLKRFITDIFSPGNPQALWQQGSQRFPLSNSREFSQLLSDLCDGVFDHCPIIRNELINREQLSSAASRARRELIQAMLLEESEPILGMSGTGPEVAIYRTMLLAEGLHQEGEDGKWRLVPPSPNSKYYHAWRAIEKTVEDADNRAVTVPKLINILKAPPFGMKAGPIPVLISLYILTRSDEIALYQEDAFIPYLSPEDLELMVKRPEFFTLKRFSPLGIHSRVFQIYQKILNTGQVPKQTRNSSLVGIVGPLMNFADDLPPFVKQTRTLSQAACQLLRTLLHAKDPIDLLFKDLPKAIDLSPFEEGEVPSEERLEDFRQRLRTAIRELAQAYENLLEKVQLIILESFETDKPLDDFREEMQNRAQPLVTRCSDGRLKPLVAALHKNQGDNQQWLAAIGTLASQRPVSSWKDSDLNAFSTQMHDLTRRFLALERIVSEQSHQLPETSSPKEARLVSLAKPDGSLESEVFWIPQDGSEQLRGQVEKIVSQFPDEAELKAFFALLGDHLLGKNNP